MITANNSQVVRRYSSSSANSNTRMRGSFLRQMVSPHSVGAEIGVHKGAFTRAILEEVLPHRLHLIDPWYLFGAEWPWAKGNRSTVAALAGILRAFQQELTSGTIVLHVGWDQDVLPTFPDGYFDWVYLDTSHQYEQTKRELNLLQSKVKPDGVITGDDWHEDPAHLHHGVFRAVHELVQKGVYQIAYASDADKQWAIRRR